MNRYCSFGFLAGASVLMMLGCSKHKQPPEPSRGVTSEAQRTQAVASSISAPPKPAASIVAPALDVEVARDVGRVYVLANPLADPNRLRKIVQQKRTVFAKDGVLIRCAEALGSKLTAHAAMSFAKSDYNGAYARALEMGVTGEQARAVADSLQSGSLDMFTMGQELLWLAEVLPAAAEGDWEPFETTGTQTRQYARQILPFIADMSDPAMAAIVKQAMAQCGPLIEEQTVWLAMMTGVSATSVDTPRETDFASAMARLRARSTSHGADLAAIKRKVELWQQLRASGRRRSARDFAEVSDAIYTAAAEQGVRSNVVISTHPGTKATIKYQTFGQRYRGEPPMTAKGLSRCTETMAIGCYYIWSERQNKKTSNDDCLYMIVDRDVSVELEESNG